MPQAAVAAMFVQMGMTATAASVAAYLTTTVASMALSAGIASLAGKPDVQSGGVTSDVTTVGSNVPRSFILGKTMTGGHATTPPYVFDIDKDDRKYLSYVIDIADMPITAIDSYIIDGKEYTLLPKKNPGDAGFHHDDYLGQRVDGREGDSFISFNDGRQTVTDPMLLRHFSTYPDYPIDNTFIFKNVAYAVATFKYSTKDTTRWSGMPDIKFVCRGSRLYDPRKDSTNGGSGTHRWNNTANWEYSDNPIVQIYNILRGIEIIPGHYWGLKAQASALPASYWFAAMNACDEMIDGRKRYTAGMEIITDQEPLKVIEELLKSASAKMSEVGGQYIISVGAPNIPSAHITDDIVIEDNPRNFTMNEGMSSIFNGVVSQYPAPNKLWQIQDAVPLFMTEWEKEDGRRLTQTINFPAVSDGRQVRQLMREFASDNRRQRQHTITLPPSYLGLNPLDTISWTSEKNGYSLKLFEVTSVAIDPQTLALAVHLRERDPKDYDPVLVSDNQVPSIPVITEENYSQVGVPGFAVSPIMIKDSTNKPRIPGILITWDDEVSFKTVRYEIKETVSGVTIKTGSVASEQGRTQVEGPILPSTAYLVRSKSSKRNSVWSGWVSVTTGSVARVGAEDIDAELIADVDYMRDWIGDSSNSFAQYQNTINNSLALLTGNVSSVRGELSSNVTFLVNKINAEANIARNYANTAVYNETIARQNQYDGLAAQVSLLTSTLTGNQMVLNGSFLTGTGNDADSWAEAGTIVRLTKNTASTNSLVSSMPRDAAISMASGNTSSINQTVSIDGFTADDKLQYRLQVGAAGSAARSVNVSIRFKNASGTNISPFYSLTHSVDAGSLWRGISDTVDIPADSKTAVLTIRHESASGNIVYITGVEAQLWNAAIESRLSTLEGAFTSNVTAIGVWQANAIQRFGNVETLIGNETAARANAVSGIINRVESLETFSGNAIANISRIDTAISDVNSSLTGSQEYFQSIIGLDQQVRDPVFAKAGLQWAHDGVLSNVVFGAKDVSSTSWPVSDCPAPFFARLNAGTTGQISTHRFPVSPDEVFDVSMSYARTANGVIPQIHYRFWDKNGVVVPVVNAENNQRLVGDGTGRWRTVTHNGVVVPATAVSGQIRLYAADATGPSNAWVTNISMKRRQAWENFASAQIGDIKFTQAEQTNAIAQTRLDLSSNVNGLANTINTHAGLIDNRFTKAQTNSAISAAITSLKSELNDPVTGKASASAFTKLSTNVNNLSGNVSSLSDSIDQVDAKVGRMNASGKIRITSQATPSYAQSMVGLHAEAGSGANAHSAGLFIAATSDGKSRVMVDARTFAVINGTNPQTRSVPFKVANDGKTYIKLAMIKNLEIGRGKIRDGSLTGWTYVYSDKEVISKPTESVVLSQITLRKGRPIPVPIFFSASYPAGASLSLQRQVGSGPWETVRTISDKSVAGSGYRSSFFINGQSGRDHYVVDKWTGTGTVSYRVVGMTFKTYSVNYGSAGSEANWYYGITNADHPFTKRFLGTFVAYK